MRSDLTREERIEKYVREYSHRSLAQFIVEREDDDAKEIAKGRVSEPLAGIPDSLKSELPWRVDAAEGHGVRILASDPRETIIAVLSGAATNPRVVQTAHLICNLVNRLRSSRR